MTTVRSEIESLLAAFAATKNVPVAYENVKFTKPETGSWLMIEFFTEATRSRGVDASGVTTRGMFQVSVYGRVGVGMGDVETLADEVCALFPVVPKLPVTSIEAPPSKSSSIIVDEFVCVPITVRYRTES